jgi:hypothetical protein
MSTTIRTGGLIALLAVLAACAGRDFARPSPEAFKLGQTTYAQIVQQRGEPNSASDGVQNGQRVRSVTYRYTTTADTSWETGVVPVRTLVFYFHQERLVGYEFVSSFKADSTDFDETKIAALSKGRTTRAEVMQLLGKPSAAYIPPMVTATAGEAIGYGYARREASGRYRSFHKALRVTFDDQDRVADVDYTSSGVK